MLKKLNCLLKHFHINIQQIINNSDNEMEDIINEGYIVLYEHYNDIQKNDKIFINELKKRCLKFNKYSRRIDTKTKWEEFNELEKQMFTNSNLYKEIDTDSMCLLADIQKIIGENNYNFLIDYYSYGYKETSNKYNISPDCARKRVSLLIKQIQKKFKISQVS